MMNEEIRLSRRKSESIPYLSPVLNAFVPLAARNTLPTRDGLGGSSSGERLLRIKNSNRKVSRFGLIDIQERGSGARKLIWNNALECGIKTIDAQHRNLFEAGNKLLESVHHNPSESHVTLNVQILIEKVKSHFKSEESLLATWKHPLTEDHKDLHNNLLVRANDLLARSKSGTLSSQSILDFLVDDLVYGHIASEDCRFLFPI